ncbi:MAG: glycosyltransferase family 4 protein [Steroidobacteraceae bacterium]
MEVISEQGAMTGKRVLMVAACPFPARRGTPVRIERMAEALSSIGHEVHVATYHLGESAGPSGCRLHRIRKIGIYKDTGPGPSWRKLLLADPLLAAKVLSVARSARPHLIHAHHFEGVLAALPTARLLRIPLILDAHVLLEGELQYYRLGLPAPFTRFVSWLLDGALPRACSHVVAISPEIRDRLVGAHGLAPDAVTVVPNGVERPFFDGQPGIFPVGSGPRLVFAGNLAAYQGISHLLEALPHVVRDLPGARLVMVTEDDASGFLADARAAGVAGNVEVLPASLSRLPDILASADVLLNPRTECPGVPLKLLNYMASGRPIVSFDGSSRYLVDGQSGIIVSNGDIGAFAAGIVRAVTETAWSSAIGAAARDYAHSYLSWEAVGSALNTLYGRLAPVPSA